MKTFIVILQASVEYEVKANNSAEAASRARRELDPDIDWDVVSTTVVLPEGTV